MPKVKLNLRTGEAYEAGATLVVMIVLHEAHLRRTLRAYASYCNGTRTHLSLSSKTRHSVERSNEKGGSNSSPISAVCIILWPGSDFQQG